VSISTGTVALTIRSGRTRANNAIVALATDGTGSFVVQNNSPAPVDLVLDVNGCFE
jgi:hypothetical protein